MKQSRDSRKVVYVETPEDAARVPRSNQEIVESSRSPMSLRERIEDA